MCALSRLPAARAPTQARLLEAAAESAERGDTMNGLLFDLAPEPVLTCAYGIPWLEHFGPTAACRFCDEPDPAKREILLAAEVA